MQHTYQVAYFTGLLLLAGLVWPAGSYSQFAPVEWQQAAGPYGGDFSSLYEDPYTGRIWGLASRKLYYSDDHAEKWHAGGIRDYSILPLAFDEDLILAGRFFSLDNGLSWQQHALPDSVYPKALVVDETTQNFVAATFSGGVWVSEDAGSSWQKTLEENFDDMWSIDGTYIIAHYYNYINEYHYYFRSSDGGVTWQTLQYPGVKRTLDFVTGPDSLDYILVRGIDQKSYVYTSSDYGDTWEELTKLSCRVGRIVGFSADNEIILGGDWLYRLSLDDLRCEGVYDEHGNRVRPHHVEYLDSQGNMFVSLADNKVMRSDDGGRNWIHLSQEGITGTSIYQIEIDRASGDLWVGANEAGVYKSIDDGKTWEFVNYPSESPSVLFAGVGPEDVWIATHGKGLFRSRDNGKSWTEVESDSFETHIHNIVYDSESDILYAQSIIEDVYYSKDQGDTWQGMGAPHLHYYDASFVAMTLGPDGDVFLLTRYDQEQGISGLWRGSVEDGVWAKVDENFNHLLHGDNVLLFDRENNLWASNGNELFRSRDEGVNWEKVIETPTAIFSIIETPDGSFWLGLGNGLLRSVDRGNTWREEKSGMGEEPCILTLAWNDETNELLAGLHSEGIYRASLDVSVRVAIDDPPEKAGVRDFKLENYPNPARDRTTLTYSAPEQTSVSLSLFDQLGRKVKDIVHQPTSADQNEISLDLSNLAPGLYFIRLQSKEVMMTKAMVVLGSSD